MASKSPAFRPRVRPDRIKLLEDGRKYRGSTHSCRAQKETLTERGVGPGGGGSAGKKQERKSDRAPKRCVAGVATEEEEKDEEERNGWGRLHHVALFYSFFGPVIALMSSYSWCGRERSATRPDITSRATQLRVKGLTCDLRGDGIRTDRGERAIYSATASPQASVIQNIHASLLNVPSRFDVCTGCLKLVPKRSRVWVLVKIFGVGSHSK